MTKKSLGGGPYRIRIGDDSWGTDIRTDLRDYNNVLLPDGYFTGVHVIFADRDPTINDTYVILDGEQITLEPRKWEWVNTTTYNTFSLSESDEQTVILPNAGGTGTGDWLNPVNGLAEDMEAIDITEGVVVPTVVTEAGFTGNAQRLDCTSETPSVFPTTIGTSIVQLETNKTYTLSIKYTTNKSITIGVYKSDNTQLSSTSEPGAEPTPVLVEHTFNTDSVNTSVKATFGAALADGEFLVVDEFNLISPTQVFWEKKTDANNLTSGGAPDGSIVVTEDGKLAYKNTFSGFLYVDSSRSDQYTPDGSSLFPYKSLKACIDDSNNNCTVILNEGTYDAGETLTVPDSMNLVGATYDNCLIAADITFTNYSGDGQTVKHLRFTGNVTMVAGSSVVFERCFFVGASKDILLNGDTLTLVGCSFDNTLTSLTIGCTNTLVHNTTIDSDISISGASTKVYDGIVSGQITHEVSAGVLHIYNSTLSNATGLVSNVTGNSSNPIVLSNVIYNGALQFNVASVVLNSLIKSDPAASLAGDNIVINTLTTDNVTEFIPVNDYHPATRKFVLDNASGSETKAFVATLETYFSHYKTGDKVVYTINSSSVFSLEAPTTITPITISTDVATAKAALTSEGWTFIAELWDTLLTYSDGDKAIYNDVIYVSNGTNTPDDFANQNWTKDVNTVDGYSYYKAINDYPSGTKIKFYYNTLENQTAGALTPTVTSSDVADMITEGWTLISGTEITEDKFRVLTPDGVWNTSIKDRVVVSGSVSPVESFLNHLPVVVADRDPVATDLTVNVGSDSETVSIEYGWRWVNSLTESLWECRGISYVGGSFESYWVLLNNTIKITSNDTSWDFLDAKVTGTSGEITTSILSPGGTEQLSIGLASSINKPISFEQGVTIDPTQAYSSGLGFGDGDTIIYESTDGTLSIDVESVTKLTMTTSSVDFFGNITVTGTVDGRDIAADGTKLDGIDANAEANDPNTTLQGNIFNGNLQLVQLDASGRLPAVDGSQLTGITTDAPVTSVFGRVGDVVASSGDYTTDQIIEGTNKFVSQTQIDDFHAHTNKTNLDSIDQNLATTDSVRFGAVGLGIGVSTPEALLHVKGASNQLQIEDSDDAQKWRMSANVGKFFWEDETAGTFPFTVEAGASNYRLYISNNESIGIGTSTPALNRLLHIKKDASDVYLRMESEAGTYSGFEFRAGTIDWDD
jgi:hypothetical protein